MWEGIIKCSTRKVIVYLFIYLLTYLITDLHARTYAWFSDVIYTWNFFGSYVGWSRNKALKSYRWWRNLKCYPNICSDSKNISLFCQNPLILRKSLNAALFNRLLRQGWVGWLGSSSSSSSSLSSSSPPPWYSDLIPPRLFSCGALWKMRLTFCQYL